MCRPCISSNALEGILASDVISVAFTCAMQVQYARSDLLVDTNTLLVDEVNSTSQEGGRTIYNYSLNATRLGCCSSPWAHLLGGTNTCVMLGCLLLVMAVHSRCMQCRQSVLCCVVIRRKKAAATCLPYQNLHKRAGHGRNGRGGGQRSE